MKFIRCLSLACAGFLSTLGHTGHADPKVPDPAEPARPDSLTVSVGDVTLRIDGPKLWTLSRIDYRKTVLAIEDSAYGSVFTIRNVGALGSTHFLEVPDKPGELEKEAVTRLQFLLDDVPVAKISPKMNLAGQSFRMERRSKIRSIDLETSLSLRDGALVESVRVRTDAEVDLRIASAMMYAWTPTATVYLFGDDEGVRSRGTFLPDTAQATEGVDRQARWMAVYDAPSGKGAVTYVVQHAPDADTFLMFTDGPKVYRKLRLLYFPEQIMPAGFDGTFQTATGFFTAAENKWEAEALQRVAELKTLAATLNSP